MCLGKAFGFRLVACIVLAASLLWPQTLSHLERSQAEGMLQVVADDINKHYYDPKLHGVDWESRVAEAKQAIDKAPYIEMANSYIAAALDSLNDSHTLFYPPGRGHVYDYGFQYQMFGDRCFITRVRPQSDAEAKGVKPGDEILTINGSLPDRNKLPKMEYVFHVLRPQVSLRLLLQNPADGSSREVEVQADVNLRKQPKPNYFSSWNQFREWKDRLAAMGPRHMEIGDGVLIVKVPYFGFSNSDIASQIGKTDKHRALILDLRGNPGGSEESLKYLVEAVFEKDIRIADRITRKGSEPVVTKSRSSAYTGKLIVLVDSKSSSASELFTRVVQIEKRGVVLGDHSAGLVMEAKFYPHQMGGSLVVFYGELISDADLIMSDGKSLEHVGVTPDEKILPSAKDLAGGRDPVLARAAEIAGVKLTPEDAGKMFPYEWPPPQ
jgi:carboxyl-terminal processing protease